MGVQAQDWSWRAHACAITLVGALLVSCAGSRSGSSNATVKASGSTTVAPVVADAAEALRGEGLDITVDSQGGSAGGIGQLAADQIDVALISKPIADSDRATHPSVDFRAVAIGWDAVGIAVRREVVEGGLRSITKAQARDLFEGRVRNWSEIGGPSIPVFVYDKEPGRGTREVLDKWLYGQEKAPPPPASDHYAVAGGNEETRAKLSSTPGSVGPLSFAFVEGQKQLALLALDGVEATRNEIRAERYPLVRGLFLVTDGDPLGGTKKLVDFLLSPRGQEIVKNHGYLTLAELKSA
jgi:phosphate transport system substrate-binding protein